MSRRGRALAFGVAALACAGLAAAMASGYRSDVASQLGPLRAVVVAARALPARDALTAGAVHASLEVRRVPARFVPPGALASPAQAIGRAPAATIPAGGYVLAAQLRAPGAEPGSRAPSPVGPGRSPVEIAVTGAAALAAAGEDPASSRVDVVVTTEPRGAAAIGRTYVAASGVRLLDLQQSSSSDPSASAGSPIGAGGWSATLALTRPQALKLIEAESFAREIRLIGSG
jgi:Flp pilus assembly protein CpaB